MVPGCAGAGGLTTTATLAFWLPQVLVAVTEIFPETADAPGDAALVPQLFFA